MKSKILIPLITLVCLLAVPATAQVNYAVSGGTAYVTSSPKASGIIVIASTYNGYPVTRIENGAFSACTGLTSVTIASSVTNIGDQSFYFRTSLTNLAVDAANPVYHSLDGVLFDKAQTTLIIFPAGRGATYVIPNSVTRIGANAFGRCTGLTSVTIPNSVTNIGDQAFRGCTSLTSLTIPSRVIRIEGTAFIYCTSLTNLSVAAGNAIYRSLDGVLFDKAQTTLIAFPAGRGGSYVIPDRVTMIWSYAFVDCTSLTSVTIPSSVTSLAEFSGCTSLTNLSVDAANLVYSSLDGVLFDKAQTTLITFPAGRGGGYVIPNSVTSIKDGAFHGCANLTNVTISNRVTSIRDSAFAYCTSLTSVTIPDSVTSVGDWAFSGCTSLTSMTIPNRVTSVEQGTLSGCASLSSVTLGNSVTYIGDLAFGDCTSLTSVTIPNSVTYIGWSSFFGCTSLTNFTFQGNAPLLVPDLDQGGGDFFNVGEGATVYYYCGTTGWEPTYGGLPTVMLFMPRIEPGSAGVKPAGFGFTLTCLANQSIVVEASTNLVNWQPIWTNALSGASADFVDPQWLNYPHRSYRARSN